LLGARLATLVFEHNDSCHSPPLFFLPLRSSSLLARQTFIISLTVPIPVRGFNFLHLLSIAFWNWIEHIKPRLSALKTPYFFQSPRFSFFSLISLLHIYSRKGHFPTLWTRLLTPRPDFCRLTTPAGLLQKTTTAGSVLAYNHRRPANSFEVPAYPPGQYYYLPTVEELIYY